MDCATHLTRLADSMPSIAMGKKRQRNSFGMCGTQSIISALENAAGIKNEARAEKMRQMDCATHLRRLADSVPSSPLAQASQIGKKRQNGYFTGTQSIIAAMEHAAGNKRQRNSFGMCGTQSIIATMEDAAGIKNEASLEKNATNGLLKLEKTPKFLEVLIQVRGWNLTRNSGITTESINHRDCIFFSAHNRQIFF